MSSKTTKGPGLRCPHCEGASELRTSRGIAPLARDIYYRCRNDDCGHIFVAQLVITHTIVRSARPNPAVILPIYVAPASKPKPANDDRVPPMPANDDGDDTAATVPVLAAPS